MNTKNITELSNYRLLGRSGLRVSPLCLGTMTFGTDWGWGSSKDVCREIFDTYVERGGNFIDTANFYTGGTSERMLGEFIKRLRTRLVLATKYTLCIAPGDPNAGGNHRKSLVNSVETSLKNLKTDFIDLLWLHIWENRTPIDEIMRALDDMVRSGKVLYIGVSDTPAWKISQANTMADFRGWSPFIALQIEYNLTERTAERDLLPMAKDLNLAVTPWSPLAGGFLSCKPISETKESGKRDLSKKLSETNLRIADKVREVAEITGRTSAQVALNWLLQKPEVTSPIIGARTTEQLEDNLAALDFCLASEHLVELDNVSQISLGFPHDFLNRDFIGNIITGNTVVEKRR
ncbi:MAG: aldo/keto reductase [Deltaproteobacteria bacterium]|nr:aldo/keto reductase [Deltaproteobacteria bacterium]